MIPNSTVQFVQFKNISFLPKPVQKPHPPLLIGGESPAALRRTVRHGDVWFPIANIPRHPLDTDSRASRPESNDCIRPRRSTGAIRRASASRSSPIGMTKPRTGKTDDGERQLLTGSAADIAEDIEALEVLGVTDLLLQFNRDTLDRTLASIDFFQNEVSGPARASLDSPATLMNTAQAIC